MNKNFGKFSFAIAGAFAILMTVTSMGTFLQDGDIIENQIDSHFIMGATDDLNDFEPSKDGLASAYADMVKVDFSSVNGESLVITLDVAEDIPRSFSSQKEKHQYIFVLETVNQTNVLSFSILDTGYEVSLTDYKNGEEKEFQGTYKINGSRLEIEVPLSDIGDSKLVDFEVGSVGTYETSDSSVENIAGGNDFLSKDGVVQVSH